MATISRQLASTFCGDDPSGGGNGGVVLYGCCHDDLAATRFFEDPINTPALTSAAATPLCTTMHHRAPSPQADKIKKKFLNNHT